MKNVFLCLFLNLVFFSNFQLHGITLKKESLTKENKDRFSPNKKKYDAAFYEKYLAKYLQPLDKKVKLDNWLKPTIKDYWTLQNYLSTQPRPELDLLDNDNKKTRFRKDRVRAFKLIQKNREPEFKTVCFNCDIEEKQNCIVTYISFNRNYENGLANLIKTLKDINFTGHLVYRIGGWPNTEEGCLEVFDVPYAFKVCSVLEAKRLGYQNCLWLDTSIQPLKNIDLIFEMIEEQGICFFTLPVYNKNGLCGDHVLNELGVTVEKFNTIKCVSASTLGFNFNKVSIVMLLNEWYELARQKVSFLSFIPEQATLSFLVDKYNLMHNECNPKYFTFRRNQITDETVFFVNWQQVN